MIFFLMVVVLWFSIFAIHDSFPKAVAQTVQQPTTTSLSGINEKQIIRPWFGFKYLNVTEEIAKAVGLKEAKGRLVTDVITGGPADKAGVRGGYTLSKIDGHEVKLGGDIILKVDNTDITKYDTAILSNLEKEKKIGDNITLTVFRNGQIKAVNMTFVVIPEFLTYQNSSNGITIQYPNYWEKTQENNVVMFHSPSRSDSDRYQEKLWINIEDLPRQNITLDEYTNTFSSAYKDSFKDFKFVGPNPTSMTIAGNKTASKLIYTMILPDSNIQLKFMDIFSIISSKVYHITYAAEVNEFANYLPIIQNIIDSFKLIDLTKDSNSNSWIKSFSSNNSFTPVNSMAEHTLLVYMVGSDLESKSYAATQDILEMEQIGSSSKVNILIETGGGDSQTIIDGKRFIDFTKVQRHKILKNDFETISDLGQQNMGDPRILTDFIIWGLSEFPAKKYSIIFWDHGSGINGFGKDKRFNDDLLNLDELGKAFKDANTVVYTNFELIGFDACLMASIEVANSIKSAGNFMVSSEELEPSWGWNYTTILENLTKDPMQDGASLGRTIADSFAKHSRTLAASQEFGAHKEVTLSVIKLANIPQLIQDLAGLSAYLDSNIVDFPSAMSLTHSVDFTERYGQSSKGGSGLVDIYDLGSNIREIFPQSTFLVDNVHKSLENAIIYKVNGDARPNANGLSIYMPLEEDEFSDSSKYSLDSWQKIVDLQYDLIKSDDEIPIVETDIDGETIRGKIYSNDVSSIKLIIHRFINEGNRAFYEELEPSSFINNSNASFEYKWKNQVLSLCNSKQICSPTSMDLEVNKDKKFGFIPVVLKSDLRKSEEFVTLIYEVNEKAKGFTFLGAVPEIRKYQTIPKEKWALDPKDKIRTYAFAFEDEDPSDSNIAAFPSIQVTDKFEPKYITYNGTFDISFRICDYSNNCWITESFRFNETTEKIETEPAISYRNNSNTSKDEEICLAVPNNFSLYDNPKFGFKIAYPSTWEKIQKGLLDPWVVAFLYPPGDKWQRVVNIGVENWYNQPSLKEFYESAVKDFPFSKIIESNATTIAHNIGHKIVFTYNSEGQVIQNMFVSTVIEDKLYEISFKSNSPKFSDEFSNIIQKMIDSFIITADNRELIGQDQSTICELKHQQDIKDGTQFNRDTSMTTSNFSTYNNPKFGFKIEYPSNWKLGEDLEANHVIFFTPSETRKNVSALIGDNFVEQIGLTISPVNELPPLNEFVSQYILKIKEDQIGFSLIELNSTTFKGNPAYIIVLTLFDPELRIQIKQMSVLTVIGDNMYRFEYFAESANYEQYLPTIQTMMDSFEISPDLIVVNSTNVIKQQR